MHPAALILQHHASSVAHIKSNEEVLDRLSKLLSHAYSTVPFYSNALQGVVGLRLKEMPILTRDLLQTRAADLISRAPSDCRLNGRSIRIKSTSGSSGAPGHHFQSDRESAIDAGLLLRLYRELGLPSSGHLFNLGLHRAGEPLIETRIVPGAFTFWNLRSAQNGGAKVEYSAALAAVQPTVIYGAASRLQEFAEFVINTRASIRPRVVLTSYEHITAPTRNLLEQTFCCPVRSVYGSTELGLCAWECEQGLLHVQADLVLPEIVDDFGSSVPRGTPGRLLFTSLKSWLMPLIRYDTGDIAALRIVDCPCGSRFPALSPFEGRRAAYLYTASGRRVSPYKIMSIIDNTGIARYQLVQRERGAADLVVEMRDAATDLSICESTISVFLGEKFHLNLRPGQQFTYTVSGKLNPVISLVDQAN